MWDYASYDYRWIHTDAVINIPQDSSSYHFITTLKNADIDVPITVYTYVNVSARLVGVNDDWVNCCIIQKRSTERLWYASYS